MDDLTASTFHSWTVLAYGDKHKSRHRWLCLCKCGWTSLVRHHDLVSGHSKQCRRCAARANGKMGHAAKQDLYFFKSGPYVKIGTSDDVGMRYLSLKYCSPYELSIVGKYDNRGGLERSLHKSLETVKVHGEWFQLGESFGQTEADKLVNFVSAQQNNTT